MAYQPVVKHGYVLKGIFCVLKVSQTQQKFTFAKDFSLFRA